MAFSVQAGDSSMSIPGLAIDAFPHVRCSACGLGTPEAEAAPDLAQLLAAMPVLQDIDADSLAGLAAGARLIEYEPGTPVFDRGSAPTGLFFVVAGGVKLVALGADARSRVVELFEHGRMFGEIGVFTGERYRTWTETVAPTTLLHVDK